LGTPTSLCPPPEEEIKMCVYVCVFRGGGSSGCEMGANERRSGCVGFGHGGGGGWAADPTQSQSSNPQQLRREGRGASRPPTPLGGAHDQHHGGGVHGECPGAGPGFSSASCLQKGPGLDAIQAQLQTTTAGLLTAPPLPSRRGGLPSAQWNQVGGGGIMRSAFPPRIIPHISAKSHFPA